MKKIYTLLPITIALLSSCEKNDVYLNEDDSKSNYLKGAHLENRPLAEIKECSIIQITYPLGVNNDILQFNYNASGDPVSITRKFGTHTGSPNFLFKYDERNRLTDFIGPYSNNTSAEFWHKYFYDNRGNIVLDSGYIFPQITNGFPTNAYIHQATHYTYDNKQRIIKDSTVFAGSIQPVVNTYSYDINGNKTGSNYDDKINLNRTNKIWMFLNRDYSVNNPYDAASYITTGLPVKLSLSQGENPLKFLGNIFYKAEIIYECNPKAK
jgi:hypothetical protein